ncbi:MAG TPA: methyltransferase domain-containing protein [Stellaceae bacterium]|nr:methyltransferase domain-containing protein [Stellaceae bacterium]
MRGDYALFFGLWLQKPLQIAAVTPSSKRLAQVMAALVDFNRPGPVLELGAGTGGITRGLLRAGCRRERLITLEREPQLAAALQRSFPGIATIVGDATALDEHLSRLGIEQLCAVVSSLPIKWFAVEEQRAIVEPCLARLGPGGAFLQMTNAFVSPIAIGPLGIAGERVAHVWRNLPPSQVWAYSAVADANARETQ